MRWKDTGNAGRSGFVQSRGYMTYYWQDDHMPIAEIQFHAPVYYVEFLGRHRRIAQGFIEFASLHEAKVWTETVYRFHTADEVH
jgi:hypothetical protein